MVALILSIILPIAFTIAVGFIVFFLYKTMKSKDVTTSGTILFKLDIQQRRIMPYGRISNRLNNGNIFKSNEVDTWMPLSELTSNFVGTPGEKAFRNVFSAALTNDIATKEFATDKIDKREKLKFVITATKTEDVDEYTLRVSWNIAPKKEVSTFNKRSYTKTEVAENPAKYKGFIGFSLKHTTKKVEAKFAEQFAKVFRFRKVELFFSNGVVVIPFFGDDRKTVEKQMAKYIKILRTRGYRRGINRLSWGSGQLISKEITTPKRVNTVLKTLDFLINLSIRTKLDFVSNKTEGFDMAEFGRFAEASQIFRLALRSGDVEAKDIPVRNFKNKRKVIDFAVPSISGLPQRELTLILKNRYNRYKFVDANATKIALDANRKKPALIDVNQNWILDNKKKMVFKKAIYVVNFRGFIPKDVVDAIVELKEKGFVFAMRLRSFTEQISTTIMNVKPQFIVIDQKLSSDSSPANLIQLISIKKIAEFEEARLIFENPSKDWDKKWTDKIGIEFYYEF